MALATLAAFRATFPEFARVDDAQIQAFLDMAATSVPEDPWFEYQGEGHIYLTAHLLAQSPFGSNARFEDADPSTTYGERFERLKGIVACGARVI